MTIDWQDLARPALRDLPRYDPGAMRAAVMAEYNLSDVVPLNWNEDLFGPPEGVLEAASAQLQRAAFYPEQLFADFREAVAGWLDVPKTHVIPAHGAQALIGSVAGVFIGRGTPVIVPRLTYGLYTQVSVGAGGAITRVDPAGVELDLEAIAAAARSVDARLVWLCDPNNPTGSLVDRDRWHAFLDELPSGCVTVADEAYMDFADPSLRAPRIADVLEGRRVIVIRSFSKTFGLAGLRLGYAIADPQVAALIDAVQEPFNVNRMALAAGRAAVSVPGFVEARRAQVAEARAELVGPLAAAGIRTHPSHANFVLVELGTDDLRVCEEMLRRGILIRAGSEFGLPGFARVTVAPTPMMRRAAAELADVVTGLRLG